MTDKELDQLFKNALDHPVEGVDANAAWAEANSMIRAEQGFGLNPEILLQWSIGGVFLLALIGMTVLNSDALVEYEPTNLSYKVGSIESVNELFASSSEVQVSSNENAPEARAKTLLAVLRTESKIQNKDGNSFEAPGSVPLEDEVLGEEMAKAANVRLDEFAMMANDLIPTTLMDEMPVIDFESYHSNSRLASFKELPFSDFVKPKKTASYLALTAGATLSRGMVQDGSQGSNTGTFQRIGLKYVHGLTEKLSAGVGFEYYSMSGKGLELSYDSLNYGFGYNKTTQTIRPNSLHYLSIPVEVLFQVAPKHQFALGADFAYLMNVHSQLEESQLNDFGEVVVSNQKSWGYLAGLKDFNATASLAYSYNLNSQLDLHAMMNYGLMNVHEEAQTNYMNRMRYSLGIVFKLKQFE